MAFHNANFKIVNLPVGTYTAADIGNNISASTVHEIYCTSPGTIIINALGGGTASFPMTAGQSVKVMVGSCVVSSGIFVGFKTQWSIPGMGPIQY